MGIRSELNNIKKLKPNRTFRGKAYKSFSEYVRDMQQYLKIERDGDKMSLKERYGWVEGDWRGKPRYHQWSFNKHEIA